jgi:hypothetical protein
MAGVPGQRTSLQVNIPRGYKRSLLDDLDNRYRPVREAKARFRQLAADLGGMRELSCQRQSLLWRFVFLEGWIEEQEKRMLLAQEVDETKWLASLSTFTSLLGRIGLERKARTISPIQRLRSQPSPAPDPGEQAIVPSAPNAAVDPAPEDIVIEVNSESAS